MFRSWPMPRWGMLDPSNEDESTVMSVKRQETKMWASQAKSCSWCTYKSHSCHLLWSSRMCVLVSLPTSTNRETVSQPKINLKFCLIIEFWHGSNIHKYSIRQVECLHKQWKLQLYRFLPQLRENPRQHRRSLTPTLAQWIDHGFAFLEGDGFHWLCVCLERNDVKGNAKNPHIWPIKLPKWPFVVHW